MVILILLFAKGRLVTAGRFVPRDILSRWTFCPAGRFVLRMFCPAGRLVAGCYVLLDVLSRRTFCPAGRFV
jgi:hypothetical protein